MSLTTKIGATLVAGMALAAAAKAQTTVSAEYNSPARGFANDVLFVREQSLQVSDGSFTLTLESNQLFEEGNEFAAIALNQRLGNWDLSPAIRVDAHGLAELSVYAGKDLENGRINILGIGANDQYREARVWLTGKKVDLGIGTKLPGADIKQREEDVILGVHTADGNAGVWAGNSTNNTYGIGGFRRGKRVSAFGLVKYFPQEDGSFAVLDIAREGGDMGGLATLASGVATAQVLNDQTVHPLITNLPTYLGTGPVAAQLGWFDRDGSRYVAAQAGGRLGQLGSVGLHAGGGVSVQKSGHIEPVAEGLVRVPVPQGNIDAVIRYDRGTTLTLGMSTKF
jgi:hypothetical protein